MSKQFPIAERITSHCKIALRSHEHGHAELAQYHLRTARTLLTELSDTDTLDNAQKLVDAVGTKLNHPGSLN